MLLLSALLVVVPALLFGSGGFSEVAGERGIDVTVADHENAFLGIAVETADGYVGGDPIPVLRLTDQFSGDLVLQDVSADSRLIEVVTTTTPPPDIGKTDPLTVEASCEAAGSGKVQFTVGAEGPGAHVFVERAVPVACHEPVVHWVEFDGCGTARIEAHDAIYPLTVTKVIDDPSTNGTAAVTATIDGDGKVSSGQGGKLVAVEADGERYGNENRCTDGGNGQPTETGDR